MINRQTDSTYDNIRKQGEEDGREGRGLLMRDSPLVSIGSRYDICPLRRNGMISEK